MTYVNIPFYHQYLTKKSVLIDDSQATELSKALDVLLEYMIKDNPPMNV